MAQTEAANALHAARYLRRDHPRLEEFRKKLPDDVEPLLAQVAGQNLEAGDFEQAKQVVAWLIWAAKVYGVKAVNPKYERLGELSVNFGGVFGPRNKQPS